MQDLSLHLLDLAQNSIRAQAKTIQIELDEALSENRLSLKLWDDGKGMNQKMAAQVTHPFVTTRTTRKVGLGISLFYQNCLMAGGSFKIQSEPHKGTCIEGVMQYDHLDRLPIGDVASSLSVLVQGNPHIRFIYIHRYEKKSFLLDTVEIQKILGTLPINEPEIIQWLKCYVKAQIAYLSCSCSDVNK